jgi:hypothetical protein
MAKLCSEVKKTAVCEQLRWKEVLRAGLACVRERGERGDVLSLAGDSSTMAAASGKARHGGGVGAEEAKENTATRWLRVL